MQRVLGIDLGIANSRMAFIRDDEPVVIANRDNQDQTPSVVARGRRDELLVGVSAKARAITNGDRTITSVKRFMGRKFRDPAVQRTLSWCTYRVTEGQDGDVRVWLGDREYTPIEISSLILRRLKEDAEARLGERFSWAVITVPAYFGERQVAATREAGQLAGLRVLRILNEPTAASLALGLTREYGLKDDAVNDSWTVLVYSLGRIFDVTVLRSRRGDPVLTTVESDDIVGGELFNLLVVDWILERARQMHQMDLTSDLAAIQKIRDESERVKISLSSRLADDVVLPALGRQAIDLETELSRDDFESMIRAHIERTIELTQKAILDAHLTPDDIDQILLVGGSTAIPLVREMLGTIFGAHKIRQDVNPMNCVAMGAAVQSALVADVECPGCHERVSVHLDACDRCGVSLEPPLKVACPICYLAVDADAPECWKCGHKMGAAAGNGSSQTGSTAAPPPPAPAPPPQTKACPACLKPYRPGTVSCSICSEVLEKDGGPKCPACGRINSVGATACASCSADLVVGSQHDTTPLDLGIELPDGRLDVVIPKGMNYPISGLHRQLHTSVTGQRWFDVRIYEGAKPLARQNQICGLVTLVLPPGLPRGTGVDIALGLDGDRLLTASARVMLPTEVERRMQIRRVGLAPDRLTERENIPTVKRNAHPHRLEESKVRLSDRAESFRLFGSDPIPNVIDLGDILPLSIVSRRIAFEANGMTACRADLSYLLFSIQDLGGNQRLLHLELDSSELRIGTLIDGHLELATGDLISLIRVTGHVVDAALTGGLLEGE